MESDTIHLVSPFVLTSDLQPVLRNVVSVGKGHTQELVDKYNMKNVFKLPISEQFSATGDSGRCVELVLLN